MKLCQSDLGFYQIVLKNINKLKRRELLKIIEHS